MHIVAKTLVGLAIVVFCLAGTAAETSSNQNLFETGEYRTVLAEFEKRPMVTADDYYYLGLTQLMTGDSISAIDSLKTASEHEKNNADVHYGLAAAYFHKQSSVGIFGKYRLFKKFRRELELALESDPHHLSANLFYAFYLLEAPGFLGGGDKRYGTQLSKLRELEPAYGDYLDGYKAEREMDLARAESAYKKALQKEKDFPRAVYALAALHLAQGKYDQALEYATRYKEMKIRWDDPHRCEGDWLRGRIFEMKGNTDASIAAYETAKASCDRSTDREQIEKELETILAS